MKIGKFMSIIIIALIAYNFVNAQSHYDPGKIEITRWFDTTTSPITYEEYNSGRDFVVDANIRCLYRPTTLEDYYIDIIVNQELYPQIEDVLGTFMLDLELDGYGIILYTSAETQSPVPLRQILYDDWRTQGVTGVIFIGDLAVPWYEMIEPPDWGGEYAMFPVDLYFMDLDGTWGDDDYNGIFDSHASSGMLADIWCGRLMASPMHLNGTNEVLALRNYFRKNHDYRLGNLRLDDHALAFIDDDWHELGWGFDVAMSYPAMDSVVDIFETSRINYIDYLSETSGNQYEHVFLCAHSTPFGHYLALGPDNFDIFINFEIEQYMMQALSYNLFACSNARYVEDDNMGGWYIFESQYGLISIGSTKTGSMLCIDDFYRPLGQGLTFGEAFLFWARADIEYCASEESRPWFYGMCMQGDPTLRLSRYQPPLAYCQYEPGDINGDGSVLPDDVTYGVRYLHGIARIIHKL